MQGSHGDASRAAWVGGLLRDLDEEAGTRAHRPRQWYRFGDAFLGIGGDDEGFLARFQDVYRECRCDPPGPAEPQQHVCLVRRLGADRVHLRFEVPAGVWGSIPHLGTCLAPMLREWEYEAVPGGPAGWSGYESPRSAPAVACSRSAMVVQRWGPWAWLASNAAVGLVLTVQPQHLFFHGAAVAIRGHGVLLLGPTGAGKTSIALALAARGHGFLSDEIAALRLKTREVMPVRRAAFVRPGPAAAAVERALRTSERTGGNRRAVAVGELFPTADGEPVTAHSFVFLRRFADTTTLQRFVPGHAHLPLLGPLACSIAADHPGKRVMQILALLAQLQCWFLDSASPDGAADAIERLVEA